MWFFGADWHLGHGNIIKYCKRPFLSPEEEGLLDMSKNGVIPIKELRISCETIDKMTDAIIDNTNAVVRQEDTLVIVGDFCWTPKDNRFNIAKNFRNRINCKNVYLIWGNHDDRGVLSPLFKGCYDQYVFNVDGQKIFTSHYPCRSWDMAYHGSWSLYGHVHDLLGPEDNGDLMPYQKKILSEGFDSVLNKFGIQPDDYLVQELLNICASLNGVDLTVDVGVDNLIRGENVPFGTPWSMDDLRFYMTNKKLKWDHRQEEYKKLRS